jgi:hypothetical protein
MSTEAGRKKAGAKVEKVRDGGRAVRKALVLAYSGTSPATGR